MKFIFKINLHIFFSCFQIKYASAVFFRELQREPLPFLFFKKKKKWISTESSSTRRNAETNKKEARKDYSAKVWAYLLLLALPEG